MKTPILSNYISNARHSYGRYILKQRAIPSVADGLKISARRILWVSYNQPKMKVSAISGLCSKIHPHGDVDNVINNLMAPYKSGSCVRLLNHHGAAGSKISSTQDDFGASRYVSASVSQFAKDVFLQDLELLNMIPSYDNETTEPEYFLPLMPIVLLRNQSGMALGFSSNTLARGFKDVIDCQLAYLNNKNYKEPPVVSEPHNQIATYEGNNKWVFIGKFEKKTKLSIRVYEMPYGLHHMRLVKHLNVLIEKKIIKSFVDKSKKELDITIKLISPMNADNPKLMKMLGLVKSYTENPNVLDFDNRLKSKTFSEILEEFTDWRLGWYLKRYQLILSKLEHKFSVVMDLIAVIEAEVDFTQSKKHILSELKRLDIQNFDYITGIAAWRLSSTNLDDYYDQRDQLITNMEYNQSIIDSDDKRRFIYIDELTAIRKKSKIYQIIK